MFNRIAKCSFLFKYETQSNGLKKLKPKFMDDPLSKMNILLMTDDFLKEVPSLFGMDALSKQDILIP